MVVALLAVMFCAGSAQASCLPLPSPELSNLELRADSDPEATVAEAQGRLASAPTGGAPLVRAQLWAIIAAARSQQGRLDDAHRAVASSRSLLAGLPPSPETNRVATQLAMSEVMGAETRVDLLGGVNAMSDILSRQTASSLEYVCALALRSDLRAELLELDSAAADGIEAYATAEREGFVEARIQVASSLATIYRRSGLFEDAAHMIEEVVAFEQADRRPSQLAAAMYSLGQIQLGAGHPQEARETFENSRKIAADAGDPFGAAFTDVALCPALIDDGELDEADRVCTQNVPMFAAAKRDDLVTLLLGYRARLDLERGRPGAALAKLDEVLGARAADVLPSIEPELYHDRSRAEGELGNFSQAYQDLRHSLALQHSLDVAQRSRAAAVLTAAAETRRLLAGHRVLIRRLWAFSGLAIVAILLLIAHSVWTRGRHERNLRREQMVLRTASNSSPDTLILLDANGVIRFANRPLFPGSPAPAVGDRLERAIPAAAWPSLKSALDEVLGRQRPASVSTTLVDDAGGARVMEIRCEPLVEGSVVFGATIRCVDLTELRSLEREVLDVSTRERQRLASDLHDGLGQELTGISLLLKNLATQMERGATGTQALVEEIRDHVSRTIATTRGIAHGLSPLQVEQGSLTRAISRLAVDAGRRLHVEILVHSEPADFAVPEETADHLYRIAFEAITNASRHSGCSKIEVFLQLARKEILLRVEDNGSGLAPNGVGTSGFGLKAMAYRARLIGGTFALEPREAGGATLKVAVPLSAC